MLRPNFPPHALCCARGMASWTKDPMEWLRVHGGSVRGVGVATERTKHGGGLVATEYLETGAAVLTATITSTASPPLASPPGHCVHISTILVAATHHQVRSSSLCRWSVCSWRARLPPQMRSCTRAAGSACASWMSAHSARPRRCKAGFPRCRRASRRRCIGQTQSYDSSVARYSSRRFRPSPDSDPGPGLTLTLPGPDPNPP